MSKRSMTLKLGNAFMKERGRKGNRRTTMQAGRERLKGYKYTAKTKRKARWSPF